ncbi:MAG: LuxR family transcriptional regulator [Ectothiorhodospiraceae bacterium]|nr:LuxR family transcriptional regulator [Ectothiorhodospiraceae bacterium]
MSIRAVDIRPALDTVERYADRVTDLAGVRRLCGMIATCLRADAFNYGLRQSDGFVHPELVFLSSFPEALIRHYREADLVQVDAVVDYAYRHVLPATWDEAWARCGSEASRRRVMPVFQEYGFHAGLVVPVHGACGRLSVLSLGRRRGSPPSRGVHDEAMPALYLATRLHEAAMRVVAPPQRTIPGLTGRERQCLAWAAEGKTAWETARILGIAERTVTFHLRNACVKLGVSNRQQAVARAIALGLMATAIQDLPEPG